MVGHPSSKQWNPLLAQLQGAAELGSATSHLVLQSLVAQSANVLAKLVEENDRLQEERLEARGLLHEITETTLPDRVEDFLKRTKVKP